MKDLDFKVERMSTMYCASDLGFNVGYREQIVRLGKMLSRLGCTPPYTIPGWEGKGSHGNISLRTEPGNKSKFVITATQTDLGNLQMSDVVEVVGSDEFTNPGERLERPIFRIVADTTRLPSSDTRVHQALYEARIDVHCIIHGHDDWMLQMADVLGFPQTRSSDLEDIVRLSSYNFFLIRGHGFVCLGKNADLTVGTVIGRLHDVYRLYLANRERLIK